MCGEQFCDSPCKRQYTYQPLATALRRVLHGGLQPQQVPDLDWPLEGDLTHAHKRGPAAREQVGRGKRQLEGAPGLAMSIVKCTTGCPVLPACL